LTYLERQKSYGPDKLRREEAEEVEAKEKIRLKQYVSLQNNFIKIDFKIITFEGHQRIGQIVNFFSSNM
jgi:hypothetical protein